MKHWLSPLLVLTLLFGASLMNAHFISRSAEEWCAALNSAALEESPDAALTVLNAVHGSWSERQTYLRITVPHSALDEIEALFAVSLAHGADGDSGALRADLAELTAQLRLLREREVLSIENIL